MVAGNILYVCLFLILFSVVNASRFLVVSDGDTSSVYGEIPTTTVGPVTILRSLCQQIAKDSLDFPIHVAGQSLYLMAAVRIFTETTNIPVVLLNSKFSSSLQWVTVSWLSNINRVMQLALARISLIQKSSELK